MSKISIKLEVKYNFSINEDFILKPFYYSLQLLVEFLILLRLYCSHSAIKHFILGLRNVLPITTAKVPIVKFFHVRSGLEVDISLYNTLVRLSPFF